MRLLVIRPQAQTDVQEIWEWIAKDNEPAADRVEAAIYSHIERLVRMPRSAISVPMYQTPFICL